MHFKHLPRVPFKDRRLRGVHLGKAQSNNFLQRTPHSKDSHTHYLSMSGWGWLITMILG